MCTKKGASDPIFLQKSSRRKDKLEAYVEAWAKGRGGCGGAVEIFMGLEPITPSDQKTKEPITLCPKWNGTQYEERLLLFSIYSESWSIRVVLFTHYFLTFTRFMLIFVFWLFLIHLIWWLQIKRAMWKVKKKKSAWIAPSINKGSINLFFQIVLFHIYALNLCLHIWLISCTRHALIRQNKLVNIHAELV